MHLRALLALAILSGCSPPEPESVPLLEREHESWIFTDPVMNSAKWESVVRTQESEDSAGRLLEKRSWRNGVPLQHFVFRYDQDGREIICDKRISGGRVGPVYRTTYQGLQAQTLVSSPDGIVLEKEIKQWGDDGKLHRVERIIYPHPESDPGKSIRISKSGYCGSSGDTLFVCDWIGGKMVSESANVGDIRIWQKEFGDDGSVIETGRRVRMGQEWAWEVLDMDGNVKTKEWTVELNEGDTATRRLRIAYDVLGKELSRHELLYNAQGRVFLERLTEKVAGADSRIVEKRTFWHLDELGRVNMEILFENNRCTKMTAHSYRRFE